MSSPVILLLDFDGVLHSVTPGLSRFDHLPRLEALLLEPAYAEIQIVISSSWKDVFDWDDLRALFSQPIRDRIIDKTPELNRIHGYWRFAEINAWLVAHPKVTRWVAVDDAKDAFPAGLERPGHVVFTHPFKGLGEDKVFARLRRALDTQLAKELP